MSEGRNDQPPGNLDREFDDYFEETLKTVHKALDEEIRKYPREAYPGRGTVLVALGRQLGEVVMVAEQLSEYPPVKTESDQNLVNVLDVGVRRSMR